MIGNQLDQIDLIVVAHGSSFDAQATAVVTDRVASLRAQGCFRSVKAAFWRNEPQLLDVMSEAESEHVVIVPLLASEGYFSEVVLPQAIGFTGPLGPGTARVVRHGGQTRYYARPIGTHAGMEEVILEAVRRALAPGSSCSAPPWGQMALIVVGHGTQSHPESRRSVEMHVERLRFRSVFAEAHAVFLEESPGLPEVYELTRAEDLVVVPCLMSAGPHVTQDIPLGLGLRTGETASAEERGDRLWNRPHAVRGRRVWLSAPVGGIELLDELVMDRVREVLEVRSPIAS